VFSLFCIAALAGGREKLFEKVSPSPLHPNVINLSLRENFFEKKLFPEPLSKNFIQGKITDYIIYSV